MHPEQIKAAIRMRGTTPKTIADELGITKTTVSIVIHGRGVSARVARRISEVTGLSLQTLWPGKYLGKAPPSPKRAALPTSQQRKAA
ncbi:MAG: helix-turn-helix domain-containing protein [Burkholderiaceae bacterium]